MPKEASKKPDNKKQDAKKLDQSRQQEEIAKKRAVVIKEKLMHTKGEQ